MTLLPFRSRLLLNGRPWLLSTAAIVVPPTGALSLTFPGTAGTAPTGQSALVSAGTAPTVDGAGNLLLAGSGVAVFQAAGIIADGFDYSVTFKAGSSRQVFFLLHAADTSDYYQVAFRPDLSRAVFGVVRGGAYTGLPDLGWPFDGTETSVGVRLKGGTFTLLRNGQPTTATQSDSSITADGYIGFGAGSSAAIAGVTVTPLPLQLALTGPVNGAIGTPIPFLVAPAGGHWSGQAISAPTMSGVTWDHTTITAPNSGSSPITFNATFAGAFNGTVGPFTGPSGVLASNTVSISVFRAAPLGTLSTSAGYTLAQTAAAGVWGAGASYLTATPPAGGWPSGTTLTVSMKVTEGNLGNITNATRYGNVLTVTDLTKPVGFVAVAAQPGNMAVVVTNSAGLADPDALQFSVMVSTATAPALSDLVFCQPYPVDPNQNYAPFGHLIPVGGVGPYGWSTNAGATTGLLDVCFPTASTDQRTSATLTVQDGRGATVSRTVPVAIGTSSVAQINGALVLPGAKSGLLTDPSWRMQDGASVANPDGSASTALSIQYGALFFTGNYPPPAGEYPIKLTLGSTSTIIPLAVVPFTNPPSIEFVPSVVSTATLAGTPIGQALATTPNNSPIFTLNDGSGWFQMTTGGQVTIKTTPTATGPVSFSITVVDGLSSLTQTFSINVQQGNILPASNMDISGLRVAFTNDTTGNVIGQPVVSGVTGKKAWTIVSQTGTCLNAVSQGQPARYQIDAGTGNITAPTLLSAGMVTLDGSGAPIKPSRTDTLVVSCSDGINICTAPINVVVSWAPVTRTIHVGRGQSTAGYTGSVSGVETWTEARAACIPTHTGTIMVYVHADADPDYYANDNGNRTSNYDVRYPWQGPLIMTGVANGSVARPRGGGPVANSGPGGSDLRGKGFMVFGDGDAALINVEISACHDAYSDGSHGVEGVRKDGQTAGTLSLLNCHIHDCDNGLESGFGHMQVLVDGCLFENCGTSHVSSGACHNAYIGAIDTFIFRNSVSRHAQYGHLLKSRAQTTVVQNNVIYDGIGGSAAACLNVPNGGAVTVSGNTIEKGAMAYGPGLIRFADEGISHTLNSLSVQNNTLTVLTPTGNHFGGPNLIDDWNATNAFGVAPTITVHNNSVWLTSGGTRISQTQNGNVGGSTAPIIVDDNSWTTLPVPPALPSTWPDGSGRTLPATTFFYRQQYQDDYGTSFAGVQQISTLVPPQIRVPSSTAVGTALATVLASSDLGALGAPNNNGTALANPFGAGTTWAIATDGTFYGFTPWAPAGRYSVTANSDGSAALKIAGALTANSVDLVQLRATAPNGATVLMRYPVCIAA